MRGARFRTSFAPAALYDRCDGGGARACIHSLGRTSRGGQSSGRNANTHLSASARKECRVLQEMHCTPDAEALLRPPTASSSIADCITAVSLFVLSLCSQVLSLLLGAKCFMAPAPIPFPGLRSDMRWSIEAQGTVCGARRFYCFLLEFRHALWIPNIDKHTILEKSARDLLDSNPMRNRAWW